MSYECVHAPAAPLFSCSVSSPDGFEREDHGLPVLNCSCSAKTPSANSSPAPSLGSLPRHRLGLRPKKWLVLRFAPRSAVECSSGLQSLHDGWLTGLSGSRRYFFGSFLSTTHFFQVHFSLARFHSGMHCNRFLAVLEEALAHLSGFTSVEAMA